ncbi:MAG: hypothetical protein IPM60_00595 [Rhodospirillales bacterium]|nr:hypothetical protein [Rhodospirillales bacterium]
MTRVLLQYLLPLILPTLLYLGWAWLNQRGSPGGAVERLREGPWFWLVLAGVALMAAALVATALTSGVEPGTRIIAPKYQDGRVIPWRTE